MDLTLVINVHREGVLLAPTLRSATAALSGVEDNGLSTELLIIADRVDELTLDVIDAVLDADAFNLVQIDEGDLGRARNAALEHARGEFLAFLDGDDLISSNWLTEAMAMLKENSEVVCRPECSVVFNSGETFVHRHISTIAPEFDPYFLFVENYWTAVTVASKEMHAKFPFFRNNANGGYAYEDWSWIAETLAAGIHHVIAPNTAAYIRRKRSNSLLEQTNKNPCIPRLAPLLTKLKSGEGATKIECKND